MLGRRTTFTALVLVALVAGPALAMAPQGRTLDWNLMECQFVYATTQIADARLAPYAPAGWNTYSLRPVTGNPLATVAFEVDLCKSGSGVDGQVAPMRYASTWSPVVPPFGFPAPEPLTVLTWDVLVPDADRRETLRAAGVPAQDGAISISADLSRRQFSPIRVDYNIGEDHHAFDIVPVAEPGNAGGAFGQYIEGEDGSFSYWRTDWQTTRQFQGVGFVRLDPDSWQAAAFGTTDVPAQFFFGTWSYTNGRIVLPE